MNNKTKRRNELAGPKDPKLISTSPSGSECSKFSGLAASVLRSPLELRVVARSAISRGLAPLAILKGVGVIGDLALAACW